MTVAPTSVQRVRKRHRGSRWVLLAIVAVLVGGLTVALLDRDDVFGGPSSTTVGSGVSATQARDVAAFRRVDLAGSNNVVIRVGERQSVVVRADPASSSSRIRLAA